MLRGARRLMLLVRQLFHPFAELMSERVVHHERGSGEQRPSVPADVIAQRGASVLFQETARRSPYVEQSDGRG